MELNSLSGGYLGGWLIYPISITSFCFLIIYQLLLYKRLVLHSFVTWFTLFFRKMEHPGLLKHLTNREGACSPYNHKATRQTPGADSTKKMCGWWECHLLSLRRKIEALHLFPWLPGIRFYFRHVFMFWLILLVILFSATSKTIRTVGAPKEASVSFVSVPPWVWDRAEVWEGT